MIYSAKTEVAKSCLIWPQGVVWSDLLCLCVLLVWWQFIVFMLC